MTETYFRALSAELLAALKVQLDDLRFSSELCRRAEAALAQSEPVKTPKPIRPDCFEFAMDFLGDPEEAELRNYIEALEAALAQPEPQGVPSRLRCCDIHGQQPQNAWGCPECVREMRQQLGRLESQGATRYSEDFWHKDALEKLVHAATSFRLGVYSAEELEIFENRARAILAQWGSPKVEPVPAAEKPWERDGWCDAAGCCWFFWPEHVNDNLGDVPVTEPPIWEYRKPEAVELYPFSLPHDAVSLPNSNHD